MKVGECRLSTVLMQVGKNAMQVNNKKTMIVSVAETDTVERNNGFVSHRKFLPRDDGARLQKNLAPLFVCVG